MTETARVYGESLYELALEEQLTEDILAELDCAADIFRNDPQYVKLLRLPSVPKAERCAALDESFGGRINKYLLNFMKLLVENGTIGELPDCAEAYRARYNADNGILPVTAITAVELTAGDRELLINKLRAVTGRKIVLSVRVDPAVIGGVCLEMGGKRYDGTLSGRFEELQKALYNTVL